MTNQRPANGTKIIGAARTRTPRAELFSATAPTAKSAMGGSRLVNEMLRSPTDVTVLSSSTRHSICAVPVPPRARRLADPLQVSRAGSSLQLVWSQTEAERAERLARNGRVAAYVCRLALAAAASLALFSILQLGGGLH